MTEEAVEQRLFPTRYELRLHIFEHQMHNKNQHKQVAAVLVCPKEEITDDRGNVVMPEHYSIKSRDSHLTNCCVIKERMFYSF